MDYYLRLYASLAADLAITLFLASLRPRKVPLVGFYSGLISLSRLIACYAKASALTYYYGI